MSRSRKKTPVSKDSPAKGMKRFANKRVRKVLKDCDQSLPYSSYKKVFDSYDLCDWKYYPGSYEEWMTKQPEENPDNKKNKRRYKKFFKNK